LSLPELPDVLDFPEKFWNIEVFLESFWLLDFFRILDIFCKLLDFFWILDIFLILIVFYFFVDVGKI
jgi:hypothetical protein